MRGLSHRDNSKGAALALGILVAVSTASLASAVPIADGRFDPAEGYADGWFVDFAVEGVSTIVSGGELWIHEDAVNGDVTVLFSQPLALVDNTYGGNSVGWGEKVAPSGKGHSFKDLEESDKTQFIFYDATGEAVLDVTMDYISRSGGAYRCLGVTGGDGSVNVGSADVVLESGTSLDYNFNTLGYVLTGDSPETNEDYTENPLFPGWIFEVIYEIKVSGEAFGAAGFGEVAIPIAHDSPNKIGGNRTFPTPSGPIPEPATLSLVVLGAVGVLLRRRR